MNDEKMRTFKEKIEFLFREMFPKLFKGRMKYITLINTMSGAIHPVISVLVIKYILDFATQKSSSVTNIIMATLIYTVFYNLFNILNKIMTIKANNIFICDRVGFSGELVKKVTIMDHELYEDPDETLKANQAFNGIGSDSFGYENILKLLFSTLPNLLIAIIFSYILIKESILVVLLVLLSLIINFLISTNTSKFINKNRDDVDKEVRKLKAYTETSKNFSYGKDIRVYKLRERLMSNINRFINNYVNVKNREFKYEFKTSFFSNLTITISDLLSFLILTYLAKIGKISISDLVMLLSLIVIFTSTIHKIREDISKIYTEIPYVMDTYEFRDRDLNLNKNGKDIKFNGPVNIRFQNVSYRYPGAEKNVFDNLNFDISAGKKIALVGVNGAGKTTIVKLMTGLARPTSGDIFINDVNLKDLSDKSVFDLYSVVFQETEPLALTVAENVSSLEENININKVENVLKKVGLWEKISSFENSYNSNMLKVIYDDGIILSGGENQKLMIARALYKEGASVMIMDEPTSALDAFAEEKIYKEFDSYMGNKTAIFISHRLASTRFCDEILFLDGGKIIAKGPHQDLLNNSEEYRNMFETQGKYYKESENEEI